jgi:hypothetical protein
MSKNAVLKITWKHTLICIHMYVYIYMFMCISIHLFIYIRAELIKYKWNIFLFLFLFFNLIYLMQWEKNIYAYLYTYMNVYTHSIYVCIHINIHINVCINDDDDVYLIEKLQNVGYKMYLLTDQSRRHKYKMNSNQQ